MKLGKSFNFSEPVSSCIKWKKLYNIDSVSLWSYEALLRYRWMCFVIYKVPVSWKFLVLLFTGAETFSVYISRILLQIYVFMNTHKIIKMLLFLYVFIYTYPAFYEKVGRVKSYIKHNLHKVIVNLFWYFKKVTWKGKPGWVHSSKYL